MQCFLAWKHLRQRGGGAAELLAGQNPRLSRAAGAELKELLYMSAARAVHQQRGIGVKNKRGKHMSENEIKASGQALFEGTH